MKQLQYLIKTGRIHVDERLKEIYFGYFEGLPEHLRDQFDIELKHWTQDFHMNYESYGGKNILKVIQRHVDFFNDLLLKRYSYDTILIIGHGFAVCLDKRYFER